MWLAWRELKYNKKNYILIGITIILMLFMVIFLSGLANGLGKVIRAGIDNTGAEYFVISNDAENILAASSISEDDKNKIEQAMQGNTSALSIKRSYISNKKADEKESIAYFAVETDGFINPNVVEGSTLRNEANTIVLNSTMKNKNIKIGDKIIDNNSNIELTVVGFSKDSYYCHVPIGYVSFETFKNLESSINPYYETKYNAIAINSSNINKIDLDQVHIVDKETIVQNLPGYSAEKITINMIIWVLVIITGMILAVFFYIITIQKTKQYGVMKALGMRNIEIAITIIQQVLILSLFGTSIGIILAFGLSRMLPVTMPFYFNVSEAIIIALAFIIISILGSLLSIMKMIKVDPLMILGGTE